MDKNDLLFSQVVMMFQQTAMLGMGKIKNPVTDQIERNLEQAGHAIDVLEILKAKTRGNLSEMEQRLLETVLTELRLNFVEEKSKN